jgi:hypothetical protein
MNYEERERINRIVEASDRKVWVYFVRPGNPGKLHHFKVGVSLSDSTPSSIDLKDWVTNLYTNGILSIEGKTCEQLCDDLYVQISSKFADRCITIEVSENGELGCTINYNLSRPSQSIVI